jgi:hypothetical protein
MTASASLDATFAALADPTRRAFRHEPARDLEASEGTGERRPHRHRPGREQAPRRIDGAPMREAVAWLEDYHK